MLRSGVHRTTRHAWLPSVAVGCLFFVGTGGARADEAAAPSLQLEFAATDMLAMHGGARRDNPFADAIAFDTDPFAADNAAPASELATGLDVQVDHERRYFRARVVDWMAERSAAMGLMTGLLLSGAESGWHLEVDPSGDEEYIVEWQLRFK